MDIKFYNLDYYPVFIFAIIVAVLLAYSLFKRVKELNFYGALSKNNLYNFAFRERVLLYKSIIFFVGFVLVCIVILRPLWGDKQSEIFEKDRDVIFVLDISNSMLAQDLRPSRLEASKSSIENAIPYLFGTKVALVAFAGSSEIRCPLTDDYDFFLETLKNCVPESATVGGSFLNSALEKVVDKLINADRASRQNIIIISDGGDFVTKSIDKIAKEIKTLGVKLTIIGVGDPVYESRIPLNDGTYLSYKEEYVKTKLENEFLKEVAFKAGGNYVEIGIKSLNIKDILSTLTSADTLKVVEDKSLDEYEDRYQIFLLFAILAFLIWSYPIAYEKKKTILKTLIFMFCLNIYGGQGEDSFLAKDYKNAEIIFTQEVEADPKNLEKAYNLAHTQYALADYEKAYNSFEDLLALAVENEDLAFQDRLSYDMAVVACTHAKSLDSSDIRKASAKAKKSMDLFRQLLKNASTNPKIPEAFLYQRQVFKELKSSLKDLEEREALRAEIKAELIKEIEEEIEIDETVLAHIAQDDLENSLSAQKNLLDKSKNLFAKIEEYKSADESELIDTQEFNFLINAVSKSIKNAISGEEKTLDSLLKENLQSADSYATSVLIDLNAALAMLKDNANSSNPEGGDGEEGSEDFDEGEESDEYDEEDYNENYKDSAQNQNEQNEGASMMSLPSPEQLEGEILQSEKENNMRREQSRGKYQKVEKNW